MFCVQMLDVIRPHTTLRRFILTLLALPSSLCRTQVFAKVSNMDVIELSKLSPQVLLDSFV